MSVMSQAEPISSQRRSAATKRLAPGAYDALLEAVAVVYWNKRDFERFLRMALRDQPGLIAGLDFSGTKREVAGDLVTRLQLEEDRYQLVTIALMRELAGIDDFPNLRRHEDHDQLIAVATAAIATIRKWTAQYSAITEAQEKLEREQQKAKTAYEARRTHAHLLDGLQQRFLAMHQDTNAQKRGRDLEGLLNDLFSLFDLNPRKSFVLADEQIDGAFTFNTDDYLLEAKWEASPAARGDVDILAKKVERKGRNTLGLFVAVSGFSDPAVRAHTDCGTSVIFMDGTDLFSVLEGRIDLTDVLDAKRRHLSETGAPLLLVKDILAR
jgi:hypothetical protein